MNVVAGGAPFGTIDDLVYALRRFPTLAIEFVRMMNPVTDFRNSIELLLLVCVIGLCTPLTADEPVLSPLGDATQETRALVSKAALGYGGESQIGSVTFLHVTASMVQAEAGGEFRMTIESLSSFTDQHFARIRTSQGTMTLAVNGPDAYLVPAGGTVRGAAIRLTPEERSDLISYFVSDPLFVLRNRKSSRFLFAAGAAETAGSIECRRLHVYADGMSVVWLVDLATGRIVRTEVGDQLSEFSEWKVSGPLTVPYLVTTTTRGGKLISRTSYGIYEINPRTFDVTAVMRKPDLWLMRWKVQPQAGGAPPTPSYDAASQSSAEASKTAAPYPPPVIPAEDASIVIWHPSSRSLP